MMRTKLWVLFGC